MIDIEVYSEQRDNTGEGPLWSAAEQALYWLDIGCKRLYRRRTSETRTQFWTLPDYPGCLAELVPETIAIALGEGVQRLSLRTGAIDLIRTAPARRPGTRFNDGKVDPRGRFWAGTMQNNFGPRGEPIAMDRAYGALYRFDADGSVHTIEEGIGCPNTLAWSPDLRQFYFADSLQGRIHVYDFDADSGAVRNKRMFFEAPNCGIPDGSAIDVDGCLWNARWDGGTILRIAPNGTLDRSITLPVPRPTSCIFGGATLSTLYVTSARNGLTPAQLQQFPLSGSVFAIHGIGQGMPVPRMICG
jgi:sugar lactone lactonase YvrE